MPKAQHPKAASFVRQNLFAGVTTFAELETRVAALPDEQSRGDAFEVFAEAYLATQRKHDAANVWPLTAVPTQILQTLGLAAKDYGVDGVFKTLLGHFNAYQVKFRTNRPALTWRELSTFMGLADSPQIRSRVLLTNCDELPSVLNERQGFFCIRGADLDRLEADDFRAIEAWLADAAFIAPKKTPKEHQTEALDALLPALETHDRVSAIMACGTGKTLVALWVAERRQASKILVLLPSLALLRQVLHEWLHESSLPSLAYLCVCSDPTVKDGSDSISTAQSDLDFQVSTKAASVRDFLDAPFSGTKVVFSTYQSARVVGAALKPGEAFDLAVFDEAHKTAGSEGRNFAFALEDAKLPIRKRLFLTATPRHYNPHQQDREGDVQLVFSMDRPAVYGPQAYCLTFADAALRGIICGYKVIISVITSEMVTNELLSRGDVLVNGDPVRARQVANQIALRDAVEKYGASKAFTFHRTVASAASFVADGSEGIRTHLPEFETFHVNGTMPTARREREMRDFRAAACGVMSNARCLTEGVDVPAVDMVAFLSPRRSRVDIVQATGRAMRRSPGKTIGFVLVPLYVEQAAGESVEAAVDRAEFDEVWEVLQSLQEQDDVLAEVIREMCEQRGQTKGFDDSRFRERIEIVGPAMNLEALQNAITTACLDTLGSNWDEMYGQLKAFGELHGHCRVTAWETDVPRLGRWLVNQRTLKRKGLLNESRRIALEKLSIEWEPFDERWEARFAELRNAFLRDGWAGLRGASWKKTVLGMWLTTQRKDYHKKLLSPDQINRLAEIGIDWDPLKSKWEEMYLRLADFKAQHGHCSISKTPHGLLSDLGSWVDRQRRMFAKGTLEADRLERLNSLEIEWNPTTDAWNRQYARLKQFAASSGHCLVPHSWVEDSSLAKWVSHQRARRSRLSAEQVSLLDAIGFAWNARESRWEEMFSELKAFQSMEGHADVPKKWPRNPALAKWVRAQRKMMADGDLDSIKEQRLNAVGFRIQLREDLWGTCYERLARFYEQNGHSDVPRDWDVDPSLAHWVQNQRQRRRRNKLTPERIAKLDELAFVWDKTGDPWGEMLSRLKAFHLSNGHCAVPSNYAPDMKLAAWVSLQRVIRSKGKLQDSRVNQLEGLGFVWNTIEARWQQRLAELQQFTLKHGHSCVSEANAPSKELLTWVREQRTQHRRKKLPLSKIQQLEALGFVWKPSAGRPILKR